MNTQMIICMVIFVATLISYMLNKIPMWLTAMISMAALYITGCIDDAGALSGFSNVNTLLMACMFMPILPTRFVRRSRQMRPHLPHSLDVLSSPQARIVCEKIQRLLHCV